MNKLFTKFLLCTISLGTQAFSVDQTTFEQLNAIKVDKAKTTEVKNLKVDRLNVIKKTQLTGPVTIESNVTLEDDMHIEGNIHVEEDAFIDENLQVGGKSRFKKNVAIKNGSKLLVNAINPVSTRDGMTPDECGTTELSGFVRCKKNIDLPLTQNTLCDGSPITIGVVTIDNNAQSFIHNYGRTQKTCDRNTFVGLDAGNFSMHGTKNTGIGSCSLQKNTSGCNNVACGHYALKYNKTGKQNIAIGSGAGSAHISGDNNIYIGNDGSTSATEDATIRIGTSGIQTSCYIAGIRDITTGNNDAIPVLIDSNGQLGTISSSSRYKKDINDMREASTQLIHLRPVTFHYNTQSSDAPLEYGLIAEEVAQICPDLVVYNKDGNPESVKYHLLPSLLLNEYQQQQRKFEKMSEDYDQKLETISKELDELKLSNTQLLSLLDSFIQQDQK